MKRLTDVISREATLDAIDNIDKTACMNEYHAIVKAIDDLPSVQPVGMIPLSVIEDIKAEIEKRADDYLPSGSYDGDLYNGAYRDALYWCFDLIDRHISGKEN